MNVVTSIIYISTANNIDLKNISTAEKFRGTLEGSELVDGIVFM